MKHFSILILAMGLLVSSNSLAQTRKPIAKKTTMTQKKSATSVNNKNKADIHMSGHVDAIQLGPNDPIAIKKEVKGDYLFEVYTDPSDRSAPARKTVIMTIDIDWKALANSDKHVPIDWSWSGKRVMTVKQDKGYAIMDGQKNVANLVILKKNGKDFIFIQLLEASLTGLRQGMYVDDLARHIQAEVPGTRVVITGNEKDGLTEYVLLSYGENKVYDVTGDYHYELNNREPYFTFWFDKNKKLVKWFKLK